MVRRTKQEALATRELILDTAELLFQQHGVSRTSLHDVAVAAGVTRGAIYWHFKDKADLFEAMMARACLPLEGSCRGCDPAAEADPLAALRDRLVEMFRHTVRDAQARRVFEIATHKVEYVDELCAVRDRRLRSREEHLKLAERAARVAVRRGQLAAGTPARAFALGLHALVDGLMQNWLLDPSAFDLVRVGREAVDTYLGGRRPA